MDRLQHLLISLYLLILFINLTKTTAQSPAPAPAPPGPTNVIKILKKAGHFKNFIRLLKSTQLDSNLNSQLGNTNNGLTIFAPSDTAFSVLKTGTLPSLTDQEKLELMQFHIVPMFISSSQFETVSSPLKTHAGSGARTHQHHYFDTVYMDTNLAIYQVDKVLLPLDIFTPKPAPAPAPELKAESESPDDAVSKKDISSGVSFAMLRDTVLFIAATVAAISFSL
ncbi:fasciclin arabinogalactan protein [Salix suchowensis]|nr:fasciclin arabinogalactan protein [Salix suchowensis]